MPLSDPYIINWLSGIPEPLKEDIYRSSDALAPALSCLRNAVGTPPVVTTYNFRYLQTQADALDVFFDALAASSVARNWGPAMNSDPPFLRARIRLCGAWLLDVPTAVPCIESDMCWRILTNALSARGIPGVWEALFSFFEPQPTPLATTEPATTALASTNHHTPLKINTGLSGLGSTHADIDPLLKYELENLLYPNTPLFFETYFPRQDDAFKHTADLRNINKWAAWPQTPDQDSVLNWFRETTERLITHSNVTITRKYYTSSGQSLSGSSSLRKTDILLYPTSKTRKNPKGMPSDKYKYQWQETLVVGELKESVTSPGNLILQLAGYVREIFHNQSNRRFVHGFTLTGDTLRTWIFHRGGGFGSTAININTDPQKFADVFYGYAIMTPEELGFDTTITFDGFQFKMMQCPDTFRIDRVPLFNRKAIVSRGTTCWRVQKKGSKGTDYVLKDSWRSAKHQSEVIFLNLAKERGVVGLVEFVAFEEVKFGGQLDDIHGNIMKGLKVLKPLRLYKSSPSVDTATTNLFTMSSGSLANFTSMSPPATRTPSIDTATANLFTMSSGSLENFTSMSPPATRTPSTLISTPSEPLSRTRSGATARDRLSSDSDPVETTASLRSSSKRNSNSLLESILKRRRSSNSPLESISKRQRSSTKPLVFSPGSSASGLSLPPPEFNRIHTRILMCKGRDLWLFTTTAELLWGLHDAVEAHRSLYNAGILHRDISIFNVLLADPAHPRRDSRRGFLIDLDLAVEVPRVTGSGANHRTGTMEFMAIQVLLGVTDHTYRHDLESFFYVFLWICVYRHWRQDHRGDTPLKGWGTGSMEEAGDRKLKNIKRGENKGYEEVEESFMEWALGLKGAAEKWRKALFPVRDREEGAIDISTPADAGMLYDKVLTLLKEAANGAATEEQGVAARRTM